VQTSWILSRRVIAAVAALAVVGVIGFVVVLEPVTRKFVARDELCTYCHLEQEYVPTVRLSWSRPMKAKPPQATPGETAPAQTASAQATPARNTANGKMRPGEDYVRCADCHIPPGFFGSVYAYLHFASITDFFGYFRDRERERSGPYVTPRALTAYRVRDRLFEYDSVTCRSCHDKFEINPKNAAAKSAHEAAAKEGETCIECHYNLVHRKVNPRKDAAKRRKRTKS